MKMKKSNRILLAVGAVPVIVVVSAIIIGRSFLPNETIKTIDASSAAYGTEGVKSFDIEGFSWISIKGNWTVNVVQKDGYKVEINAPEEILEKIIVEKRDNTLVLDKGQAAIDSNGNISLEATITLPSVSKIEINGVTNLDMSGIMADSLAIETQGVTRIVGNGGKIRDLSLKGKGVSTVDLNGISSTNAGVDYEGTYTINLMMDGGRLTGRLDGVGKLKYSGNITSNEVRVHGPANSVGSSGIVP